MEHQSEGARTAYCIPGCVGEVGQEATESTLCVCVCPAGGSPGGRPRPTHKGNLKVLSARVGRGRVGRDPSTKKTLRFPLSCDPPVATHPTQRRDPPGATHPPRPTRCDPPAVSHPSRPTRGDPPAAPSLLSAKAGRQVYYIFLQGNRLGQSIQKGNREDKPRNLQC